ncbi:MAG: glycosyltransferase family 4 protein [Promethearchaeota archaeon]
MHIGFIEDTKLHGGTQLWVLEAITYFLNQGIDITVLTPRKGWLDDECRKNGLPIFLSNYNYHETDLQSSELMNIWIKSLRDCDVAICTVHPPRGNFHCSIFAAKCIKKANLKTILIMKTGTIVPTYKREFYLPDRSIPSFIVTITEYARRHLIEKYSISEKLVSCIYQGINIDSFTPNSERRLVVEKMYPLRDSTPIICSIGYLEHRKGHLLLLKALLNLIHNGFPKIHLLIVGDGPDELLLKNKVIEMELENFVTFIPFTREVVNIYERSDLLILPSLYKEGLPNVILESLAMKTPVIASNIGGISEVVYNGENGYLIEPGDVDQLTEVIKEICSNQESYQRLCNNTRQRIVSEFDRYVQFDKFLDYFQKIIRE